MLVITAMGYAGVWMDGMSRMEGKDKEIAKILNVWIGYNKLNKKDKDML